MLLEGFRNIKTFFPPCRPGEVETLSVSADCTNDISEVFPYLNAMMNGTIYDKNHNTLHFKLNGCGVTLYTNKIMIAGVKSKDSVEKILNRLKFLINRTYKKRDKIKPSYKTRAKLNVLNIYKLLPRKNCGLWGEPTCMGFAAKLVSEETGLEKCKPLFSEEFADLREKLITLLDEAGYTTPKNNTSPPK